MAITLQVEKRDKKTDVNVLRKAGRIPAVFYGKKEASTSISVSAIDFSICASAAPFAFFF